MKLPNLRMASNEYLAAIRDRVTSPIKLSDERMRASAQIMQEYKRRGYTTTQFAYLPKIRLGPGFMIPGPKNE